MNSGSEKSDYELLITHQTSTQTVEASGPCRQKRTALCLLLPHGHSQQSSRMKAAKVRGRLERPVAAESSPEKWGGRSAGARRRETERGAASCGLGQATAYWGGGGRGAKAAPSAVAFQRGREERWERCGVVWWPMMNPCLVPQWAQFASPRFRVQPKSISGLLISGK